MSIKNEDELWNEYLYEGTGILKNNFNIRDSEKLKQVEATITYEKLCELDSKPLNFNFNTEYLRTLHFYIFGDIYPFAGQYRNVNLKKQYGSFVLIHSSSDIENYLNELFNTINMSLNGCNGRQEFVYILSTLYTRLIYCHPFREGNGRTIREFIREFCINKSKEVGLGNLELDWSLIDMDELNRNIEVSHIFPGSTGELFDNALVKYNDKTI